MIQNFNRQLDIFNNEKFDETVHLIGAGATSSWAIMMLTKLGVKNVHAWDFDIVEDHNLPNQCFMHSHVGKPKVEAVKEISQLFGNTNLIIHNEAVTADTPLTGVVFVLTDTMSSREEIWKGALKYKPNVKLVIETRMGLDMCRIYNVNPTDMDSIRFYESTFSYGDDVAEVSACGTSKSVITSAITTASIATRQMLNWINGIEVPREIIYDFVGENYLVTR